MRIAIVGAGIAGVSLAWHLASHQVELFDPRGIAGGASGIATGLLHPFPGRHARHSHRAEEGMAATTQLLDIAEKTLQLPVAERTGIFRPAVHEHQKSDFKLPRVGATYCEKPPFGEGLWIPGGITVFTDRFLQGLWKACEAKGAELHRAGVESFEQLASFDRIFLAAGADTLRFPQCCDLPLSITYGQTLLCRWKEPLPFPLASLGHIAPTPDPTLCQVGSTYEHTAPDPANALALLEQVALFYPPARTFEVVAIKSAARIARLGSYLPLVQQIAPNICVFTGLGSRGLLYGPLIAKEIVDTMTS